MAGKVRGIFKRLKSIKKENKVEECDVTPISLNDIDRVVSKGGKFYIYQEETGTLTKFNPCNIVNIFQWNWSQFFFFFFCIYIISFIIFALLYYSVLFVRNDWDHIAGNMAKELDLMSLELKPCFINIESFSDCFLFSIETQQTIGPGARVPDSHCPEVIMLIIIQSLVGVMISVIFTGMILARLMRPEKPAVENSTISGIIFSYYATITARNGILYLTFRVCEMKENWVTRGMQMRAICIQDVLTQEGENIPFHTQHMEIGCQLDGSNSTVPLMWPMCICHRIDESSPLYDYDRNSLHEAKLEIVIRLWGEIGGRLIVSRTSYIPPEIIWGSRFKHNVVLSRGLDGNIMSFSRKDINDMETDNTPAVSARELDIQRPQKRSHTIE